jgi:hypothetical protein
MSVWFIVNNPNLRHIAIWLRFAFGDSSKPLEPMRKVEERPLFMNRPDYERALEIYGP